MSYLIGIVNAIKCIIVYKVYSLVISAFKPYFFKEQEQWTEDNHTQALNGLFTTPNVPMNTVE